MHAYILRGVPRSGKSTLARIYSEMFNHEKVRIFSADDYYTNARGVYSYDARLHGEAHLACFRRFLGALMEGEDETGCVLIADNTNSRLIEAAPYIQAAGAFGFRPFLVTVSTPLEVVLERNAASSKQIPEDVIREMWNRIDPEGSAYEEPPHWWASEVLAPEDIDELRKKFGVSIE